MLNPKKRVINHLKLSELEISGITGDLAEVPEDELAKFESELGHHLPNDYRDFLKKYGSSIFQKDVWFKCREPSPWAVKGYGNLDLFYGLSGDPTYDIIKEWRQLKNELPNDLLAIGHDAGANLICVGIDGDRFGKVFFRDKDSGKVI